LPNIKKLYFRWWWFSIFKPILFFNSKDVDWSLYTFNVLIFLIFNIIHDFLWHLWVLLHILDWDYFGENVNLGLRSSLVDNFLVLHFWNCWVMCLFSLYSTIWGGRFNPISLFKGKSIEKWKPCEVDICLEIEMALWRDVMCEEVKGPWFWED
jgi:hypothetical protein